MVVRRSKTKTRKFRGSKTHGWGAKKKHRGSGSKGGKGFAGSLGCKKVMIYKMDPEHIGKKGFKRPVKMVTNERHVNVMDLEKLGGEDIDLSSLGYGRLLSKGKVTRRFTVKVRYASPKAVAKVESAGGNVVVE